MASKRITQRIPDAQRKRKPMRLSLGSVVHSILAAHPNASRYIEALVLKDQRRIQRRSIRTSSV